MPIPKFPYQKKNWGLQNAGGGAGGSQDFGVFPKEKKQFLFLFAFPSSHWQCALLVDPVVLSERRSYFSKIDKKGIFLFLSDPGVPGVRSMGPSLTHYLQT